MPPEEPKVDINTIKIAIFDVENSMKMLVAEHKKFSEQRKKLYEQLATLLKSKEA